MEYDKSRYESHQPKIISSPSIRSNPRISICKIDLKKPESNSKVVSEEYLRALKSHQDPRSSNEINFELNYKIDKIIRREQQRSKSMDREKKEKSSKEEIYNGWKLQKKEESSLKKQLQEAFSQKIEEEKIKENQEKEECKKISQSSYNEWKRKKRREEQERKRQEELEKINKEQEERAKKELVEQEYVEWLKENLRKEQEKQKQKSKKRFEEAKKKQEEERAKKEKQEEFQKEFQKFLRRSSKKQKENSIQSQHVKKATTPLLLAYSPNKKDNLSTNKSGISRSSEYSGQYDDGSMQDYQADEISGEKNYNEYSAEFESEHYSDDLESDEGDY